jgi:hypothetical protein
MPDNLSQQRPPQAETRQSNRQNVFYPQARVVLSVYFENFGDPDKAHIIPVSARSIQVYSNSYKEADTWSVEFDAKDLPVMPEMVRSGACEIFLFQSQGIGQLPEVVRAKDDPNTARIEGLEPTIVGLFDNMDIEMSNNGRTVSIDGTDYTALFASKDWDPKKSGNGRGRLPNGKKLDAILQTLMNQVDGAKNMTLKIEGKDANGNPLTMPTVGASETRTNKKGIPVKLGDNYWDVMYSLAVRHGFILFVRNLEVVLTSPQTYHNERSKIRKMVWGRNLRALRVRRRMGKTTTPIIEVRSYDDTKRKVRKARYPKNKKQVPITGVGTKKDEVKIFNIPGIREEAQLARVAETVYNLKARSEQTVEMETMDLRDVEGTDMIELRSGDAVSIGFDSFNDQETILEGQSAQQRIRTLVSLGYDSQVAATIASSIDRVNVFKRPFRVREATLEWSHSDGLSIAAELQNFINIADQGTGDTKE